MKRQSLTQQLGLDRVPVRYMDLDPVDAKLLALADNKVAEIADWDDEALERILSELKADGVDLDGLGWSDDELAEILNEEVEGLTDEDQVPEPPEQAVTVEGDLWILGDHRLLCGDSTKLEDVKLLMGDNKAVLLHADPPYGMGKEGDGVANDNLYREKLDGFQMAWWKALRPYLDDNASAYIWGNAPDLWRLWYAGGLSASERFTIRNEIVWNKGGGGMSVGTEAGRMYQSSERCLFFMFGEQGFNNNADNYWEGWDSIVNYLKEEKKKTGWSISKFKRLAGHSEKSGCHWFDKSQWMMPTKETYDTWREEAMREHDAFKREHEELKREHDALKQDFYATRAFFDNTHDKMTDVWDCPRVTGEDRHGHATPKPIALMERVMRSSSKPGQLCIEPFGGSGSTLIGAEKAGRTCYTIELQGIYCDVIIKRWEDFTGSKATLESTGQTYDEMKGERLASD